MIEFHDRNQVKNRIKIFGPILGPFLYGSEFHGFTPEKKPTKKVRLLHGQFSFFPAIDSLDENRLRNT
jgi:hypothetical protein